MIFRKRLVRLLQNDPEPAYDGILVGWPRRNAGHYHLVNAQRVEAVGRTFDVGEVWVPAHRVVFVQKL